MILKSTTTTKPKQNKKQQQKKVKNHAKKPVITIISQFTACRFCFYFLSGILLLKQENEYYSKYL